MVANGYAYEAGGNVYFDVPQFPKYGGLSRNFGGNLLEGVRAEADPLKRDARDFTLWKAAEPGRDVKWDSPWGEGFPGWHIECSAMAHKYLGERFDIHTGGVDNVFPHHEDEIAQSEGAFGETHVNYWVHGQHLLADGAKMAMSSGNVFLLDDLAFPGNRPPLFPLPLHDGALSPPHEFHLQLPESQRTGAFQTAKPGFGSGEACRKRLNFRRKPRNGGGGSGDAVNDDLDLPTALALTWDMVRSELPGQAKLALLLDFDRIFGAGTGPGA